LTGDGRARKSRADFERQLKVSRAGLGPKFWKSLHIRAYNYSYGAVVSRYGEPGEGAVMPDIFSQDLMMTLMLPLAPDGGEGQSTRCRTILH
jgi:hypothetical protein